MALEKELLKYKESLGELLAHSGKFVLIHESEIVGTYDTYDDALRLGYQKFGTKPFLVKQIQAIEHVQHFSRDLATCRS